MLERLNPVFRIVCLVLAGVVLFQVSRLAARRNALAQVTTATALVISTNLTFATNKSAALPPEISARIDKIKESQVLGMIVRPPPMALIGIAGPDVLLRGPNGQTGLIREGEELGGVKLLRIGTNRVLVEHESQQKELTLFEGLGGESLLTKGKENSK